MNLTGPKEGKFAVSARFIGKSLGWRPCFKLRYKKCLVNWGNTRPPSRPPIVCMDFPEKSAAMPVSKALKGLFF